MSPNFPVDVACRVLHDCRKRGPDCRPGNSKDSNVLDLIECIQSSRDLGGHHYRSTTTMRKLLQPRPAIQAWRMARCFATETTAAPPTTTTLQFPAIHSPFLSRPPVPQRDTSVPLAQFDEVLPQFDEAPATLLPQSDTVSEIIAESGTSPAPNVEEPDFSSHEKPGKPKGLPVGVVVSSCLLYTSPSPRD